MINYKLAKQLKDAGFPQWNSQKKGDRFCKGTKKECYIPTLSELIEACGEEFLRLLKLNNGEWTCENRFGEVGIGDIIVWGKSPEEAVAKLWLKLNK